MLKPLRILSTACGAIFMPGFFSCLKNNHQREITIVGVDISDDFAQMANIVDKYYQVPRYTDANYIDTLLRICTREKIDIFFPHISMELPIVLERLDDFRAIDVKVAISDNNTLSIANNKLRLYDFMSVNGIATPKYVAIDTTYSLRNCITDLGYPNKPVVVKMAENSGSRGVRIIQPHLSKGRSFISDKPSSLHVSLDEMCEILDDCNPFPEVFAMEYLPGVEYTVDLLADHGTTLYIAGRRNTSSSMSIAQSSVVEKKQLAYDICTQIVKALSLDGNIGFDFMLDENDVPWLTDLNPRVTATIVLYVGAGLNLPYLRVKQLLGEELPRVEVKYGTKLVRKYHDILYNSSGTITL